MFIVNPLRVVDRYRDPRLRGCHINPRRTKSTRQRDTPENAAAVIGRSENLCFRMCRVFGCFLFSSKGGGRQSTPDNATHLNRRFWEWPDTCVFGCVAFRVCFGACHIAPDVQHFSPLQEVGGFQRFFLCEGGGEVLHNWGRARTGCNN